MDNRHCLRYTIGKKDEMERMYLLAEIWSKFGNKNGLECSSKNPCQNLPLERVARIGCRVAARL